MCVVSAFGGWNLQDESGGDAATNYLAYVSNRRELVRHTAYETSPDDGRRGSL